MDEPIITLGTRVLLPDGDTATVTRHRPRVGEQDDGTVEVMHLDRSVGRGPWVYHRSQLTPALEREPETLVERTDDQLMELLDLDVDAFHRVADVVESELAAALAKAVAR